MKAVRALFALVCAVVLAAPLASADNLHSGNYAVYEQDVGYGVMLYIVPKEVFLILHGPVATPIAFWPEVSGYSIFRASNGVLGQPNVVAMDARDAQNQGYTLSDYKLFSGDFNGNGGAELLLQGSGQNKSFALTDTGNAPAVYHDFGNTLSQSQVRVSVYDNNGDGRADIQIQELAGGYSYALLSEQQGGFEASYPVADAPVSEANVTQIGAIAGQFRVDEQGAATYNIPFKLGPGTAGVKPQLGLSYSSSGGSNIAGQGWTVSGLSAIGRCRQTYSQDGAVDAITLTENDRFCMDGQRLILVNGSQYGAVGAEYRTEVDSYAVVQSHGGSLGHPDYFSVTRKDGSTSYYGNGNGSKHALSKGTLTWAISRFEDSAGNPIRFSYTSDGGHSIQRIDYAYGAAKTAVADSDTYIEFVYVDSPNPKSGYLSGEALNDTKLLQTVHSFAGNQEFRSYHLAYRDNSSRISAVYLDRIYECVADDCLTPTRFTWEEREEGYQPYYLAATNNGETPMPALLLDMNGDSRSDIAYIETDLQDSDQDYYFGYKLSDGANFNGGAGWGKYFIPDNFSYDWNVIDFNNDGRQDFVYSPNRTNWRIYPGTSSGISQSYISTSVPYEEKAQFLDFNGDGLVDVLYTANNQLKVHYLQRSQQSGSWQYSFGGSATANLTASETATPPHTYPLCAENDNKTPCIYSVTHAPIKTPFVGDLNGDGRVDVIGKYSEYVWHGDINVSIVDYLGVYLAKSDNTFEGFAFLPMAQNFDKDHLKLADLNGDGLTDIITKTTNGWRFYFSKGDGTLTAPIGSVPMGDATRSFMLDYNNDGHPDLYTPSGSALRVSIYDPQSQTFSPLKNTGIAYSGSNTDQFQVGDIDGDGHLDIFRLHFAGFGNNQIRVYKSKNTGKALDKIARIENGMGNVTELAYKSLSDGSVYTRAWDANAVDWPLAADEQTLGKNAPTFDLLTGNYVVARARSTAPRAGANPNAVDWSAMSAVSYHYEGAKMQAHGRGLLGFAKITSTDEQSGVKTTTQYRQDFPFVGYPLKTEVRVPDGQGGYVLSKRSQNHYAFQNYGSGHSAAPYRIYGDRATETSYDPVTGMETGYVTTEITQDEWGNTTHTLVSTYEAGNHGNYLTQVETVNNYGSSNYDLRYGRLSSTTATYRRAGAPSIARSSAFTYYSSGPQQGLLQTEVLEPNDPDFTVTTTYLYDDFGNKIRATRSAAGQADRYTRWEYDALGRFVDRTYQPFGGQEYLTEEVTQRTAWGAPLEVQALNGGVATLQYDVMGREIRRGDNTGAWQQTGYSTDNLVTGAQYSVTVTTAGGGSATEYFDALGRTIANSKVGFDGSNLWTYTEYDSSGRVVHQSLPFKQGGTLHWGRTVYDRVGRVIQDIQPDSQTTTYSYSGLTSTVTNALNQTHTETRDAAGQLVKVVDAIGGSVAYRYAADGSLIETINRDNDVLPTRTIRVAIEYDRMGRKTKMQDPDKGTWFYRYNPFGELTHQYKVVSTHRYLGDLDAALADSNVQMQRVEMDYDAQGRMDARRDYRADGTLEDTATWSYDSATNGVGQLASVQNGGIQKSFNYDSLGRANGVIESFDSAVYMRWTNFDSIGRVQSQTDLLGSGSGSQNHYNNYGYLSSVSDLQTGVTVYQVDGTDSLGNVTEATLGNGLTAQWAYNQQNGRLISQSVGDGLVTLQQLDYSWDVVGNLLQRTDARYREATQNINTQQQSYCYDDLNRLLKTFTNTTGTCAGLSEAQQDQRYDAFGNITYKAGVGAYTYGTETHQPHAVQSTSDGVTYNYDHTGNMLSDSSGRQLDYTVFDKPGHISKGNSAIQFAYGPDRSRYLRIDTDTSTGNTRRTHYVGGAERVEKADGSVEVKRYLAGGAMWVHHFDANGVETQVERRYLHKDHQGSTQLITNQQGQVEQSLAFNPWGERVNNLDWNDLLTASLLQQFDNGHLTNRGYTGHEMLDAVGLVHMNGRIYESRLARFLQADPYIQASKSTQSYNRYTYVGNNPLNSIDPSGYFSLKRSLKKLYKFEMKLSGRWAIQKYLSKQHPGWSAAVQVGLSFIPYGFGDLATAHFAFDRTLFYTDSLTEANKTFFASYGSSYVFSNLGGYYDAVAAATTRSVGSYIFQGLAYGVVGGIAAEIQGGKFGHGFVSAGINFAAGAAGDYFDWSDMTRTVASVIASGTASEITGGKFANGAVTAAFAAAVSAAAQKAATVGDVSSADTPENRAALQKELDALSTDGTLSRSQSFDTADDAAKHVLGATAPLSKKYGLEVGGNIYQGKGGQYHYTLPQIGDSISAAVDGRWMGYHTHPSGSLKFSNTYHNAGGGNDAVWVQQTGKALYLGVQQSNGVGFAVCEPGRCLDIGRTGSSGRVLQ